MRAFRDLKVWQKSHQLTLDVYAVRRAFPRMEQYGLTGQLRRAASSIPANLGEGGGRASDPDFLIAAGSASELQHHVLLSHDLGLVEMPTYLSLSNDVHEVKRMLYSFAQALT
jgi:four helix bundle protein